MNTRFYNARIFTMEENRDVFEGEIGVQDDKIVMVIDYKNPNDAVISQNSRNIHWDNEVDCNRNLVMPGFKNAHTHSPMTFLRSFADDLPLEQWLQNRIFPMEAKLTDNDIYEFAKLAMLEYFEGGITSIFDMYIRPDMVAKACMEMGMRCVLVSGLNNFTSSLEQMEDEYKRWNSSNSLIKYCLGFHAEYTCSEELLKGVSTLAHKYQAPVFCHLSETQKEVNDCKKKYGLTPTVFLDSLGIFDFGGGGYHCVYMTEEDMDIFAKRGLFAVSNPASNLKLASGIAPIAEFEKRSIPVALGTDGPASNNCLDMFREMFLVSGLSKVKTMDASATDGLQVLKMATVNGAYAMGIPETDSLQVGKMADLIMIDLKKPNMQPIHNITKNLVYSGNKSNVMLTMIDGKVVYRDGEFPGIDKEAIYETCAEILKRM